MTKLICSTELTPAKPRHKPATIVPNWSTKLASRKPKIVRNAPKRNIGVLSKLSLSLMSRKPSNPVESKIKPWIAMAGVLRSGFVLESLKLQKRLNLEIRLYILNSWL